MVESIPEKAMLFFLDNHPNHWDDLHENTKTKYSGNHAQFGSYGEQSGDGTATMSGSEQLKQTVDAIVNFVQ